jgi:hypothetical protein
MIGNVIKISGMLIEIVSDDGERWKCRNVTTGETVFIQKTVIESALRLGKAEIASSREDD